MRERNVWRGFAARRDPGGSGVWRAVAFSRLFRRPHPRYCGLHAICQERIP
jgi:hypothetical protein